MKRPTGFTLLELLAVMVVIALVAALVAPWLARARHEKVRAVCRDSLKQVGMAFSMYTNDWNGWHPTAGVGVPKGQERTLWSLSLTGCCYIRAARVLICPGSSDKPERVVTRNHRPVASMTAQGCSYAYDPQKPPKTLPGVAIAADKPGPSNPRHPQFSQPQKHWPKRALLRLQREVGAHHQRGVER